MKNIRSGNFNAFLICFCFLIVAAIIAWSTGSTTSAQNRSRTDLALVLAIDCSYSVDQEEYRLQMQGLALALSSEEVINSILSGPHKSVAILVAEWAGEEKQLVSVPWTIIGDAKSMRKLANHIAQLPRRIAGKTSISAIINFASRQFRQLPVNATRHVVDISADGVNNVGELPYNARAAAIRSGITINGLAIINEVETLDTYFEKYIIGGQGHFVLTANDYPSYQLAIKRKLLKEIRGAPIS